MSEHLPWSVVAAYCVYSIFSAQQKSCVKHFRGPKEGYRMTLGFFGFATMVFGLAFLVFYGFRTVWWAPIALFAFGLLAYIPFTFLVESVTERFMHLKVWGAASFAVIPVCGYLLIRFTPK